MISEFLVPVTGDERHGVNRRGRKKLHLGVRVQPGAVQNLNRIVKLCDRELEQLLRLREAGRDLGAVLQVDRRPYVLKRVDDSQEGRDRFDLSGFSLMPPINEPNPGAMLKASLL